MTSPQQNPRSAQQPSAPPRFVAGAVDLGDVKRRAEARESAAAPGGVARSAAVTVESFEQDLVVRSTQVPVVLLIGSGRSPESEEMRAEFSRLVDQPEHPTWLFRHVDVDTSPEIAQALRVQAVPTVLALAAGRPMTSFEGGQPAEQLAQWVEAVVQATEGKLEGLPEGAGGDDAATGGSDDPRVTAAEDLMETGDYAGAVAAYDRILAEEPDNTEARAARATAELMRRTEAGDADEVDQLILAGRKAEGFDVLVGWIRSGEDRDGAKARLLELFGLFDPADPDVIEARTKMASALF
ncbi:tetratricopeptide repeat protein [Corynebacterium bovis]|uniref:tetratricopeptide repeat protein n=1 Tax=Corynebacterium bovis TaxID=36808 RepID=UPI0031390DDB